MKVSFVIPCYRSERTLEPVVREIQTTMEKLRKYEYEIVLVNDCSPDGTFDVIKKLCAESDNIIGVSHARNFGQHSALMAGFHFISGDVAVSLDDDGQTPADEIGNLLQKIEEGYDVVMAKYDDKKHSRFRNFGTFMNNKMIDFIIGKNKELFISSYFVAKRFVIDEIIRYKNAYPYVEGLLLRTTQNICNVSVKHRAREVGTSGYSFRSLFSLWMNGFTAFSVKPLRIATCLGFLIAFLGFLFALHTIITRILNPAELMGWSSLFSGILILGGIVLLMLGIIGEYIGRIYICINNAPQYIIKTVLNYNKKDTVKNCSDPDPKE